MSTQLILYPQTYNGEYNSVATPVLFEYVVDGINFTSINGSASVDLSGGSLTQPWDAALLLLPPDTVNTWYRYRTTSPGTPALPTQTGNNLIFTALTTTGDNGSGVYQRLSNLDIGQGYEVTINLTAPVNAWGHISVRLFNGNNLAGSLIYYHPGPGPLTSSPIVVSFTAQSNEDVIMVSYFHNTSYAISIDSISVKERHGTPTLVYSDLSDGQVICDLYEEEDIPLTLSIDDFKNVAEQVKSYSKDFNLPATKRNNKIFNNMFEITRSDDQLTFNPYIRTQCVLKQDGFILFEGYLRMIDVKDKEGEISYNVNLYSEVIALADILKDQTFSNLDFSELEHDYNKTEIEYSWNNSGTGITYLNPNTSGFRDANDTVKYPNIDWNHQFYPDALGNPVLSNLESMFRPCIQLKYLINKIFAASGFNWTSDFFDGADFGKLYMDFNWGADGTPVSSASTVEGGYYIGYADNYAPNGSYGNLELTYPSGNLASVDYDTATNKITSVQDNSQYNIDYSYEIDIVNVTPDPSYSARWLITRAATGFTEDINLIPIQTITANQTILYSGNLSEILDIGDTLEPQFYSSWTSTNSIVQGFDGVGSPPLSTATVVITKNILSITSSTILQTLRGELGQWDFLKGIMTMFNLVSLVDEADKNNILIEPYGDIFINNTNCSTTTSGLTLACRSIQHDWTDKVDVSQMELKPLTELNRNTIFKFVEDDDDYAFNVFKQANSGHLYGSKERESGFTILEGTEEIIAEPFAATVSKPIMPQFSSFIIPSLYAMNDSGLTEGFDNSPRIFYNNGEKSTGASYYIPAQNGVGGGNEIEFLQFSHLSTIPSVSATTKDFVFASHQLPSAVGFPPADNLYNTYWQPYFNELYHPDTRIMTLKVALNPSDIASFKMYDLVFIKNRSFRVNKIDYKPNSLATVEFILIA